jgi:hypothetical protein
MNTEDTEWQGSDEEVPMDEVEYATAMEELLAQNTLDDLGKIISGVLEFLTARAVQEGSYYIMTDNKEAITVFAANEDAVAVKDSLPDSIKSWDDLTGEEQVITDRDPGDEQDGNTE